MKIITRDVVTDLWPVYESGEASADTKAIVDEFLSSDPEFAGRLRAQPKLNGAVTVPPDVEVASLKRTRDLVKGNAWLRGVRRLAVVLTGLTFARIISDTTFTRPPRVFIAHAVVATAAWVTYVMLLRRYRQRALRPSA